MQIDHLFKQSFQTELKKKVHDTYFEYLKNLKKHIGTQYQFQSLSEEFSTLLGEVMTDPSLQSFSPLKFYWINLLDDLFLIADIHDSIDENRNKNDTIELSEEEDEVFTFWHGTDFAQAFKDLLDKGQSIIESSEQLISILENQVIGLFLLHCTKKNYFIKHNLLYTILPEVGDCSLFLRIGDNHDLLVVKENISTFPTYSLVEINTEDHFLEIEDENHIYTFSVQKNPHPMIHLDDVKIALLPTCEKGLSSIEDTKSNITKALKIIKNQAPELLQVFKSFTNALVLIDEPGIVSYSMQELPGFSSINTFERDFIDLMDDLLHENGHHFLNACLNVEDLIEEDDEKIYFSAWRKQLRPIRGIYHAYCTFYWALHLFSSLSKKSVPGFSLEQNIKIKRRFCEEFIMLNFTYHDLKRTYEKDRKITDAGMGIVEYFNKRIQAETQEFKQVYAELKESFPSEFSKILQLETDLKNGIKNINTTNVP